MAVRRISTACLASSSRTLLAVRRASIHFTPRSHNFRQLHTTAIRYEQQQANAKGKRDPGPEIARGGSKVYKDADEAVADLKSGSTILSAGFGLCGTAGKSNLCDQARFN